MLTIKCTWIWKLQILILSNETKLIIHILGWHFLRFCLINNINEQPRFLTSSRTSSKISAYFSYGCSKFIFFVIFNNSFITERTSGWSAVTSSVESNIKQVNKLTLLTLSGDNSLCNRAWLLIPDPTKCYLCVIIHMLEERGNRLGRKCQVRNHKKLETGLEPIHQNKSEWGKKSQESKPESQGEGAGTKRFQKTEVSRELLDEYFQLQAWDYTGQ